MHPIRTYQLQTGWPQFGKKKIQGLFKDLELTFPDLFRRRFCYVAEVLVMTILESMQCFGIKRKPLGSNNMADFHKSQSN